MVLMIAYDLHEPDRDYEAVIKVIKDLGLWCHVEESVWLVDTATKSGDVRDQLSEVSKDATYLVQRVTKNWSSWGASEPMTAWLKSADRSW
jgi:hypothetical protein